MTRYYAVQHPTFGQLIKADDTIADARAWARTAFPGIACTVTALHPIHGKACPWCHADPCTCHPMQIQGRQEQRRRQRGRR